MLRNFAHAKTRLAFSHQLQTGGKFLTFLEGMVGVSASTFLPTVATASGLFTAHSNDYNSLDDLTKRMLEELGTATRSDVKDHKPNYLDNASFSISARIKGYDIEYGLSTMESKN